MSNDATNPQQEARDTHAIIMARDAGHKKIIESLTNMALESEARAAVAESRLATAKTIIAAVQAELEQVRGALVTLQADLEQTKAALGEIQGREAASLAAKEAAEEQQESVH